MTTPTDKLETAEALHWYCLSFSYGDFTFSTYNGYPTPIVDRKRIEVAKLERVVASDSPKCALIAATYLGHMSREAFEGEE